MTLEPTAADFDTMMERLTGGGTAAPAGADPMLQMMMMQMQSDRADRAASRQTMIQMITSIAPLIIPLLFKKDADPVMMTLLQGLMAKNNDGEQTKAMLQMMAAGNQMTMEQMRTSLMSIMEMKDQQTKKMLEDRAESDDDGPKEGAAGLIHEIRMGLGSLVPLIAGAPPAAPAQTANLPAPAANPAQNQQRQPKPPVVVVLNQMKGIQTGQIKKTEHAAALAAMVTVALQDAKLIEAFDTGDINEVVAYCVPFISTEPKLMTWLQSPGVGEWVNRYVEDRLGPMLDVARDLEEPADDTERSQSGPDDNEPEELAPPEAGEGNAHG